MIAVVENDQVGVDSYPTLAVLNEQLETAENTVEYQSPTCLGRTRRGGTTIRILTCEVGTSSCFIQFLTLTRVCHGGS